MRQALPHNVVDAEYSAALDAIVMAASYPRDALYVYDVDSRSETEIALAYPPCCVSVGPDGLSAAAGHDGHVSYIDLTGTDPVTLLDVSANVHDIVLDSRGYAHVVPEFGADNNIHSINVSSNVETVANDAQYHDTRIRLAASGDFIYAVTDFVSPSDLEKFDVSTVPATRLYDSPYHGDYGLCGDFWLGAGGQKLFTACGNTFTTSAVPSDDLLFSGALTISPVGGYGIQAISDAPAQQEIALIEQTVFECAETATPGSCFSHLLLFDALYNLTAALSFSPITVDGYPYAQRGMFVFHSADGSKKFTLSRLFGIADREAEFYVSEI
jgi:hypothetical protein